MQTRSVHGELRRAGLPRRAAARLRLSLTLCGASLSLVACGIDARSPSVAQAVEGLDGASDGGGVDDSVADEGAGATSSPELGSDSERSREVAPGLEPSPPGEAGAPARLVANTSSHDFGGAHAGGEPELFEWIIQNTGGSTGAPLTLSSVSGIGFGADSDCGAPLPAGATCSVRVSFAPQDTVEYVGELRLSHGAETLVLALSGKGQNRMTITLAGDGQVTSSPGGMTCDGDQCVGLYDPVVVTFTARTENGSGRFFANWSAEHCRASQSCDFTMTRSGVARVLFPVLQHNLIFTSSTRHRPNAGGLAAYDAECNRLASEAGINDATGDAYIAAMSDGASSLRQRLGAARGWIRMDGQPFADTPEELFDEHLLRYYVAYDERGVQVPTPRTDRQSSEALNTLSGTLVSGSASANHCNSWTSSSPDLSFTIGRVAGGPESWIIGADVPCDSALDFRLLCMGVSRSLPVPDPTPAEDLPPEAKQIWVTNTPYIPGSMTPDAKCQSERPADVQDALAYVAYTDQSAAAVLDAEAVYVRPDGVVVGTGADLVSMDIYSTPWIHADGSVAVPLIAVASAWTGARTPSTPAVAADNCNDWQDSSEEGIGLVGNFNSGSTRYFYTGAAPRCSFTGWLYCVEP